MKTETIRKTIRDLPCKIRMSKEAHELLKRLKRLKKQSMAQIIIDLVEQEYRKLTT